MYNMRDWDKIWLSVCKRIKHYIYFLIDRLISPWLFPPPSPLYSGSALIHIYSDFLQSYPIQINVFHSFLYALQKWNVFYVTKFQTFEVYSAIAGAPQRDFKLGYGINILHKVPGFLLKTGRSWWRRKPVEKQKLVQSFQHVTPPISIPHRIVNDMSSQPKNCHLAHFLLLYMSGHQPLEFTQPPFISIA